MLAAGVGAAVATVLGFGGLQLLQVHREAGKPIALGIPVWVADLAFPIAFGLIALRLVWNASTSYAGRALAALGIVAGVLLWQRPELLNGVSPWPGIAVLIVAAVCGMPIFALLGGCAVFLFLVQGDSPANAVIGGYDQLTSEGLAAIPLFTLAGYLLAEGQASERLLRLFRAFFGWMPGGTAIVTATLCAFFTLFTGGSGVTILALGGLLLPALLADGYRARFSLGLLTASGSLGLLFPPALPLILYGIVRRRVDRRSVHRRPAAGHRHAAVPVRRWASAKASPPARSRRRSSGARPLRRSGTRSGNCSCRSSSSGRCCSARRPCSRRRWPRCSRSSCSGSSTGTCRTSAKCGAS